jgi:molybdopterin molybdotransferase
MVSFDEARALVLAAVHPLEPETVPLSDALGRVAAVEIVAREDLVGYSRSAMDGYAVRAADTAAATPAQPASLPVVGKVLAERGQASLPPASAMAIATGAPVPLAADAVIPHEQIERSGNRILIARPARPADFIFPPAEDARAGERLVAPGEVLRPATLGLLAFVGCARLAVYRRPRVAVVATGSELVEVEATPAHGQVRNSNIFTLAALIAQAGAELSFSATAPDDRETLRRLLDRARQKADLVVTTGGASVGERDLVKGLLAEMGATFRFRQVAMRPGKPIGFALWDRLPVVVLPGNPAAAFVGFEEFVRPALALLAGRPRECAALPVVRARLRSRVSSKPGRHYLLLAQLGLAPYQPADKASPVRGEGIGTGLGPAGLEVAPLPNQCSVLVRSAAEADALILLPEGPADFQAGDVVDVQVLDWDRAVARAAVEVTPAAACSKGPG